MIVRTCLATVALVLSVAVGAQPSIPAVSGFRYAIVDTSGNVGPAATTPPVEGDQLVVSYLGGIAAIAPGQVFRYIWTNLTGKDPATQHVTPISVQFKLFSPDGKPLAQGGGAAVGPGEFATFDVAYESIARAGEPGSGRVQFQLEVGIVVRKVPGSLKWSDVVLKRGIQSAFDDTAELFDRLTGRTSLSWNPKNLVIVRISQLP